MANLLIRTHCKQNDLALRRRFLINDFRALLSEFCGIAGDKFEKYHPDRQVIKKNRGQMSSGPD